METTGVGLDYAGIDGEALAADQTRRHAATDNFLEDSAQDIALAEPAVTAHREGRMVGNLVL